MTSTSIETQHEDMIHDVQPDYYGRRLASCSSDRTIKIFDIHENSNTQVAELKGHEGPVWQVAWAHPKFGSLLASCSYDRKIIIWKEVSSNQWVKYHEYSENQSSVNSIVWAPHEFGLMLACGSSDGSIRILINKGENDWAACIKSDAHSIGVNSISWGPANTSASILEPTDQRPIQIQRLVSGGCDNAVKFWRFYPEKNELELEQEYVIHKDWVRDVAWSPNIGLPTNTVASCSQDGQVYIWTLANNSNDWKYAPLTKFGDVVWRLSWSITGSILAISGGNNNVTLWKETGTEWKQISTIGDD